MDAFGRARQMSKILWHGLVGAGKLVTAQFYQQLLRRKRSGRHKIAQNCSAHRARIGGESTRPAYAVPCYARLAARRVNRAVCRTGMARRFVFLPVSDVNLRCVNKAAGLRDILQSKPLFMFPSVAHTD
jgi:hypothetical protein